MKLKSSGGLHIVALMTACLIPKGIPSKLQFTRQKKGSCLLKRSWWKPEFLGCTAKHESLGLAVSAVGQTYKSISAYQIKDNEGL